jgi:UDP-glucoronosyl/UDP-glucosyl transferase
MRILFTTLNATSHLRLLAPIVLAARAAGHETLLAGPPGLAAEAAEYGVDFAPVGADWTHDPALTSTVAQQLAFGAHEDYNRTLFDGVFFGRYALDFARDGIALARRWRPDLVVRVTEEVGGLLLAEALGLPHATVGSGNAHRMAADAIMSSVDRLRRELGLPTGVDPYPSLFASFVPRSYPGNPAVPTIRWYRQRDPERIGERMPDWFADLPADRPVVYVAIGSWLSAMVWKTKPQIEAVVAALEAMDCTGIVAVGDAAAEVAAPGSTVRVVGQLPQPMLLPSVDLFVSHGGAASVREALRAGTPMVMTPIIGDQVEHARFCTELGVARTIATGRVSARAVRAAVSDVLGDPAYRQRARAVQREFLAAAPVEQLVDDLAAVAAG